MSATTLPRVSFRIVEQIDGVAQVREEVLQIGVIKVGKLASAHLRIADPDSSRMHAVIEVTDDEISIIDLGSARGTQVNGATVNKATLWDGDVIGIASATIEVRFAPPAFEPYVPADAIERGLIDAIRQRDPGTHAVYADWLEQAGRAEHAAYIRMEIDPMASSFRELRATVLADRAATGWRAIVSRVAIDACKTPACPARWDALAATGADDVRRCATCTSDVPFCTSKLHAAYVGRGHGPIAIDPALGRDTAVSIYKRAANVPVRPRED